MYANSASAKVPVALSYKSVANTTGAASEKNMTTDVNIEIIFLKFFIFLPL